MLILRTVMPRRRMQRKRTFWPCHLAFQLGRSRTAGPFFFTCARKALDLAGKSWAWTVLFSGQGDSMEMVKVRTLWGSRRESEGGEGGYPFRLASIAF